MALRRGPSLWSGTDFTAKALTNCFEIGQKCAGIDDSSSAEGRALGAVLSLSRGGTAFRGFQIFERAQRAVYSKIAVVDEQLAAHPIGVEPEVDLVARGQIAALGLEIADRNRP